MKFIVGSVGKRKEVFIENNSCFIFFTVPTRIGAGKNCGRLLKNTERKSDLI